MTAPDERERQALLALLRRELRAARSRALAEGAPLRDLAALLDERIRLLSERAEADRGGAWPDGSARRDGGDDVEHLGDDPVELGGIGQ